MLRLAVCRGCDIPLWPRVDSPGTEPLGRHPSHEFCPHNFLSSMVRAETSQHGDLQLGTAGLGPMGLHARTRVRCFCLFRNRGRFENNSISLSRTVPGKTAISPYPVRLLVCCRGHCIEPLAGLSPHRRLVAADEPRGLQVPSIH